MPHWMVESDVFNDLCNKLLTYVRNDIRWCPEVFGIFSRCKQVQTTASLTFFPFAAIDSMSSSTAEVPRPLSSRTDASYDAILKSMLYHQILEKRLIPPKKLGIPLKQIYPADWNFHFQRAYRYKYGPDGTLSDWKRDNPDLEMSSYLDPDAVSALHSVYLFSHPAVDKEFAYLEIEIVPRDLRAFGQLRILQRNCFSAVTHRYPRNICWCTGADSNISIKEESERQQCPCGVGSSEESPIIVHECIMCEVAWRISPASPWLEMRDTMQGECDEKDESDSGSDGYSDNLPPEDFESSTEDGRDEE
ncbi:hypothetical protein C8R45DRAFT_938442 [Mycena sanguinolenta]|nr:hypothetical protein C8R45DRAFT_938442 [Mycena sanguinolenta]